MAGVKTFFTDQSVVDYIEQLTEEQKKADSYRLIELMKQVTGEDARMFGPSIIGFGQYHYKYASGHEGDAPILGFSPRKAAFSLYVHTGCEEAAHLLENLGKYKISKACIYIKKLADIKEDQLLNLMQYTLDYISEKYQRIKQ
ncbi:DUF1801 domain-containing protein [Sphingobacterium psychroaquaticum]|uniref:YdhG-like domain-containing protein n=1 Tax=Sphingobacterium psychroaquaticum TaxID=561061 RepID=A0A1X7HUU3_9SPHI|nr:DUF1801 domain-containing protein [Sphingobacterium psychroaquaticum]SMG05762.1 protein of unknown function (DU1801) [Sphingobacterium psychroaquaticum]